MADLTNWGEDLMEGVLLEGSTAPATWYLALLHSVTDKEAGTVVETSVAGYGRATIANNGTLFTDGVSIADITFATPTATDTADVTHFALYDALTLGNCCAIGALDSAVRLNDGGAVKFPSGSLTFDFD